VTDTGIGIEPDVLPLIFETFVQVDKTLDRSRGGLGLGLALVKGLVEMHGGTVEGASPGLGQGATFTLHLPLLAGSPVREAAAPRSFPSQGSLRVLIVEDNADTAQSLRELLELSGCTVQVAASGPAALAVAPRFRPEVVLCDIGLPGMDGYEVARQLRQNAITARARLVAVTGYGDDENRERARAAGFEIHLTKPLDLGQLQRFLELSAHGQPRQERLAANQ
jgi:CheY-like chemotaxis protein